MERFSSEIRFRHPWRTYQARVLAELEGHLDDDRLHVVAAPGSGKTVLGLEVVRRLGRPTLILAPTLTIRDQWVDCFVSLFLPHADGRPDWISADLRQPRFVTVATYQALHSAERESRGAHDPEERDEQAAIAQLLRASGIETVVLDEAHHLRSEWWRTLERVRHALGEARVVALTATPPYDVPPAEWDRYEHLCGPVDAEVSAPELVLNGDLCPHQDYAWLSTPTADEAERIREFRWSVDEITTDVAYDQGFVAAVQQHPWVQAPTAHVEEILDDPGFFSSMLIFLNHVRRPIPAEALHVLGVPARALPALELEWYEALLTGCLYTHADDFASHEAVMAEIERRLKRVGAIERRRVTLRTTRRIARTLASSTSKLDSIANIVRLESTALGSGLRMAILTDFIRAADLPHSADDIQPLSRMGVAPIFETIRRARVPGVKLAALSGSLVVIPCGAQARLLELAGEASLAGERLRLSPLGHDAGYLRVQISGERESTTVQLVTDLLSEGEITVLVGTASLLGEGWDAPCINCLVLASFVASYMLSNQMRGRAIRAEPGRPGKTANVWHPVCVEPDREDPGDDVSMLARRFRAFVGVAADEPAIENGVGRLGMGDPPFTAARIEHINAQMARRAVDREGLRRQWAAALAEGAEARLVEQIRAPVQRLPRGFVFANTIAALFWQGVFVGGYVLSEILRDLPRVRGLAARQYLWLLGAAFVVAAIAAAPRCLKALWLLLKHGPVASSVKQIGDCLLRSLIHADLVRTPAGQLRIVAERHAGVVFCSLDGGTTHERSLYLDALHEVLDPIVNPRYLIVRRSPLWRLTREDYHAVPTAIGRRKEFAEFFARMWRRYVGRSSLVYTRNLEGRRLLLRARARSLAAAFQDRTERVKCWQ